MNLKLQTYILRLLVHKQMNVTLERKGNKYGGFIIATDRLSPNCTVLSFGIGRDISFDAAMMTEYQAQVYGFDPTPKSIIWVEKNINDRRFHFFPYGISDREESAVFYLPSNPANVSGSIVSHAHCEPRRYTPPRKIYVPMKSITEVMKETGVNRASIIKMDIEGSEFKVIPHILDSNFSFHQLCVEVHWRFFPYGCFKLLNLICQMNRHHYYIAGYSDNFEDITFVKGKLHKGRI